MPIGEENEEVGGEWSTMEMETKTPAPSSRWSCGEVFGGLFLLALLAIIFGSTTFEIFRPHDRTLGRPSVHVRRQGTKSHYSNDLMARVQAREKQIENALGATIAKELVLEAKLAVAHSEEERLELKTELAAAKAEEVVEEMEEEEVAMEELTLERAKKEQRTGIRGGSAKAVAANQGKK